MPNSEKPQDKKAAQVTTKKTKKDSYEPPKLEKFGTLEKLIVSGE
jgi:hypothetical protein